MPRFGFFIFRPDDLTDEIAIKEARRVIAESVKVLETNPPPDTFLGRQTYGAISLSYKEE